MKIRVKYFVTKGGRYYWQPSAALKAEGWKAERLDDNKDIAQARAFKLTQKLTKWQMDKAEGVNVALTNKLCGLLDAWEMSPEYDALAKETKKYYRSGAKTLRPLLGEMAVNKITAANVNRIKQSFYHAKGKAAQLIRTGQAATAWAIRSGLSGAPKTLDLNPWAKQRLEVKKSVPQIWTPEQVDQLVIAADKIDQSIGTAILLMEWLGHYPQDIINLTWACYNGRTFNFTRQKTGAPITIDASPRIKERLLTEKFSQPLSTYILAAAHTGKPWKIDNFRKHFRDIRAKAAKTDKTILTLTMGKLRHTAVTNMFDNGTSEMDIAAITGHKPDRVLVILDTYNKRTEKQARRATMQRIKADGRHSTPI